MITSITFPQAFSFGSSLKDLLQVVKKIFNEYFDPVIVTKRREELQKRTLSFLRLFGRLLNPEYRIKNIFALIILTTNFLKSVCTKQLLTILFKETSAMKF